MGAVLSCFHEKLPLERHRSLHCQSGTIISVTNLTKYDVRVYWIDYKGKLRLYTCLPPRKSTRLFTFTTHPWTFRAVVKHSKFLFRYANSSRKNNLICASTHQQIIYPLELPDVRHVEIIEASPVTWSPETAHFFDESFKSTVKTVLCCQKRLQKCRAKRASFGDLPKDVLMKVVGQAAPVAFGEPKLPPFPAGASEMAYSLRDLGDLFDMSARVSDAESSNIML